MPSTRPFVDPATGEVNTAQVISEAVPLGKLIGVFVAVSLVPYAIVFFGAESSVLGALIALVGDLILTVGAGIVLLYVVARGIQLSSE
mgnify:CR=1 FL=1